MHTLCSRKLHSGYKVFRLCALQSGLLHQRRGSHLLRSMRPWQCIQTNSSFCHLPSLSVWD